jgi:cell division protein FtsW
MKDFIQKNFKGDPIIWTIVLLLIAISAVEMYSASSALAFRQSDYNSPVLRHILFLSVGFCIVFVVHLIPYKRFPMAGTLLLPFSIVLLAITLVMGVSTNNASRWLEIGGFQFQPSELAKLAVIIVLAFILGRKQQEKQPADESFKIGMIILAVTCVMILPENFSTGILLFLVGFLMMFFGRISLKKLGKTMGIIVGLCLLLYLIAPYMPEVKPFHRLSTWRERVDQHFFNKGGKKDLKTFVINDDNYQAAHAKIAVANSNGLGLGIGNSVERDFLPQAYSDFIFAIIIEETGLIGALVVMLLYLILLFRAGVLANKSPSAFSALLVMGLTSMIVVQAFLNMAVAVGLAPVTGQPLPMISRGGTSILVTSIYFGIILSVSRYVNEETQKPEEVVEVQEEETQTETVTA